MRARLPVPRSDSVAGADAAGEALRIVAARASPRDALAGVLEAAAVAGAALDSVAEDEWDGGGDDLRVAVAEAMSCHACGAALLAASRATERRAKSAAGEAHAAARRALRARAGRASAPRAQLARRALARESYGEHLSGAHAALLAVAALGVVGTSPSDAAAGGAPWFACAQTALRAAGARSLLDLAPLRKRLIAVLAEDGEVLCTGAAELDVGLVESALVLAHSADEADAEGTADDAGSYAEMEAMPSMALALEATAAFASVPSDESADKAIALAGAVFSVLSRSACVAREGIALHDSGAWRKAVRTIGAAMVCGALRRERRSALHACWQRLISLCPRGGTRAAALEALCVRDADNARALPPPAAALALKRLKDEACAEWAIVRRAPNEDGGDFVAVDSALRRAVGDALLPPRGGLPALPHDLDVVLGALNALRFALVRQGDESEHRWDAAVAKDWLRAARSALDGAQAVAAASADSTDPDDIATARAASGASALQEALTAAEETLERRR